MRTPKRPTQHRGKQRVTYLLAAADHEIAKVGYDSATMSQIAERAGSSIGSLYQFFPNKEAIVRELRAKYCGDLRAIWSSLLTSDFDGIETFVVRFVDSTLAFLKSHQSFLALINAPSTTRVPGVAGELEEQLADLLQRHLRGQPREIISRKAASVLQISKSMMMMYASAKRSDHNWIRREFTSVLLAYLTADPERSKIKRRAVQRKKRYSESRRYA